jgi:hypothetical protein
MTGNLSWVCISFLNEARLSRAGFVASRTVSEPAKLNVVDQWLITEAAAVPDCPVVAVIKASTKSMKLDEGAALTKLRELYKEPSPAPEHVTAKTD